MTTYTSNLFATSALQGGGGGVAVGNKKYDALVSYDGMTIMPSFVKIGHVVGMFEMEAHTQTAS
jgi:hypothetical protein